MNGKELSPAEIRSLIRESQWNRPTTGLASGFVQANLVILPKAHAFDFLLFCVRNPKPCPILDVLEPGNTEPSIAPGADLRTDLPKYRIYEQGTLAREVKDIRDVFKDDMVSFLLGCSFSFEKALMEAGIPVRNIEEGKNVSMYITNRPCIPAGAFSCPLVVSMRPMQPGDAIRASQVTTRFHLTHGAPVHLGAPHEIGIKDLDHPDFGDSVTIHSNEIPVFWACGVTSQMAVVSADLSLVITHSPGHMFISDLKDEQMTLF